MGAAVTINELIEAEADFVRLRLQKTATTPTGIGGSVNGGVLATMIDMAGVAAVFTKLVEGASPEGYKVGCHP